MLAQARYLAALYERHAWDSPLAPFLARSIPPLAGKEPPANYLNPHQQAVVAQHILLALVAAACEGFLDEEYYGTRSLRLDDPSTGVFATGAGGGSCMQTHDLLWWEGEGGGGIYRTPTVSVPVQRQRPLFRAINYSTQRTPLQCELPAACIWNATTQQPAQTGVFATCVHTPQLTTMSTLLLHCAVERVALGAWATLQDAAAAAGPEAAAAAGPEADGSQVERWPLAFPFENPFRSYQHFLENCQLHRDLPALVLSLRGEGEHQRFCEVKHGLLKSKEWPFLRLKRLVGSSTGRDSGSSSHASSGSSGMASSSHISKAQQPEGGRPGWELEVLVGGLRKRVWEWSAHASQEVQSQTVKNQEAKPLQQHNHSS